MPGMATNSQLDELRKAKGKAAEVLYLKLMTAHHKGGVDMAKGAVELVKDSTESTWPGRWSRASSRRSS